METLLYVQEISLREFWKSVVQLTIQSNRWMSFCLHNKVKIPFSIACNSNFGLRCFLISVEIRVILFNKFYSTTFLLFVIIIFSQCFHLYRTVEFDIIYILLRAYDMSLIASVCLRTWHCWYQSLFSLRTNYSPTKKINFFMFNVMVIIQTVLSVDDKYNLFIKLFNRLE